MRDTCQQFMRHPWNLNVSTKAVGSTLSMNDVVTSVNAQLVVFNENAERQSCENPGSL
jgi:hypothetical protein